MSYSGKLTTALEVYDTAGDEQAMPFYQYLNLSVNDPFKLGSRNYFYLYGRVSGDINDNDNPKSHLYSAFYSVNDILPHTDIRVGRQFVSTVAGSAVADGVELRVNEIWKRANFRLFTGGDVKFVEKYEDGDWVLGASSDISGHNAIVGVSYFRKEDGWDKARESIGLDASYFYRSKAKIYGEARYDLIAEYPDYYNLGGKLFFGDNLTTSLEYTYILPIFDATDIYSVFAVEEHKDLLLNADYRLNKYVNLFGSYTRELYEDTEDSDIFELGGMLRRYKNISADASLLLGSGEDDIYGGKLQGRYYLNDKLDFGAGVEYDQYREIDMSSDEAASLYFADANYSPTDSIRVFAKLETYKSEVSDNEIRGLFKFSYAFRSK